MKENKCKLIRLMMVPREYSLRFSCEYTDEQRDCTYFKRRLWNSSCMYNSFFTCICEDAHTDALLAEKLEEL